MAKSNIVLNFQKQLNQAGFNTKGVDGMWGNNTQRAWEQAQKQGYINSNGRLVKQNQKPIQNKELLSQQTWLFNNGMYDNSTRQQAIDGLPGKRTTAAFNKAKQLGYTYRGNGNFIKQEGKNWQPTQKMCRKVYNPVTKKYTTECSEYANQELAAFKHGSYYTGVAGDAWTRVMNGDNIQSGYDDLPDFETTWNPFDNETKRRYQYSVQAAEAFKKKFRITSLKPGEVYMANMYFKGSPNVEKAFANGTGIRGKHKATRGTHTGNIYYDNPTKTWRISHNIHGQEHNERLVDVLGGNHKYGVTAISRVKHYQEGGQMNHLEAFPNGVDLSFIGITKDGKKPLQRYANADSPMIGAALASVYDKRGELMNKYNLTQDEFVNLAANTHGILYKESNGGYPTYLNANGIQPNTKYAKTHLNAKYDVARHLVNSILRRDSSEGMGSVKNSTFLEKPKVEFKQYSTSSPQYGGLSTFQVQAQNFNALKKMFRPQDQHLLYNEDGSISDLANAMLQQSHNQGMTITQRGKGKTTVQDNYNKYIKDGNINHLTHFLNHKDSYYNDNVRTVIDGHQYQGIKPIGLPEVIVTANKINKQ